MNDPLVAVRCAPSATSRIRFCLLQRGPSSIQHTPTGLLDSGQERNCMASRRTAIYLIAIGISAIASIGSASALDYPTRPVRWVVGYPPGGATDILARLIGQRLSERLGQQFVIENKPGARNNIATHGGGNAGPPGQPRPPVHPPHSLTPSPPANLKFNFIRDIAPIAA